MDAQPPAEHNGDSTSAAESQRSTPSLFLTKTYQLVNDPSTDDVISWNEDGSTIIIWKPVVARDLFRSNNFAGFVRLLHAYGFTKVAADRWEFSHKCFRRGEQRLLCEIQRRRARSSTQIRTQSQVNSPWPLLLTDSSSSERSRSSSYSNSSDYSGPSFCQPWTWSTSNQEHVMESDLTALDLMPMKRSSSQTAIEEMNRKEFGVANEAKRSRYGGGDIGGD